MLLVHELEDGCVHRRAGRNLLVRSLALPFVLVIVLVLVYTISISIGISIINHISSSIDSSVSIDIIMLYWY